ncbi:hypothetical protein GCM10010372_81870 [Streptomyces tauricus]|uniref:ABC transporter ATP-binding protein n=1 Tax=Streptomyces tauricus TaxID=68274 RepID=UPI0016784254|nr:ABC transporter ATP-binding protein [Streptomyces tauricus]GHA70261.1 hypothetical protein GCM10010372_81870 [Streptomyces tauricus]
MPYTKASAGRPKKAGLRPQSITAGRQRWEVGYLEGSPQSARAIEAVLRQEPHVTAVRANPATGRVLIRHRPDAPPDDISARIRCLLDSVGERLLAASAEARTVTAAGALEPFQHGTPGVPRPRPAQAQPEGLLLSAAAAVGLALCAGGPRWRQPLLSLGAAGAATAVLMRRSWRKMGPNLKNAAPDDPAAGTAGTSRDLRSELVIRHRGRIARATAWSVAGQCADTSVYLLFGRAMSIVMRGESKTLAARGLDSPAKQLWAIVGTAVATRATAAALSYRAEMSWRSLGQDIAHEWRTELYPHVEHLQLSRIEDERATRVAGVVGEDINQLGTFLATTPHEVTQLTTSVALMAAAYFAYAPQSAWVAFLPLPLIAWISLRHQERSSTVYAASGHDRARLSSQLVNSLQANATVKSFCGEDHEAQRVESLSAACRRTNRATDRYTVRYTQTVMSLTAAAFLANLLVSGREAMDGTLSLEAFSMFTVLPQQTIFKLTALGATMDNYQRTLQALDRIEYLHSLPTEPVGTGRRLATDRVSGDITLDNVTFAYPGRTPTVRNLSLHFPAGTTTGIVGATGAGKSTIAKLLTRFHTPQSGRILLDGQDIQTLDITDLRHAVGFVAQDAFLFDGTIDENLRYGTFDADHDALVHAARMAEATPFIDTLPNRYRTAVGERGTTLSGGQKQRIALARTFLKNPPVLILDEATSAVDNETEAAIQRGLAGFTTDRTAIVIAHRLPTVRHADQIYVLDDGGVLAEAGTHDELLALGGLYASLWALQTHEAELAPTAHRRHQAPRAALNPPAL